MFLLVETPRVMMFDEMNKKLLSQNCIKILGDYEEELKRCFTLYYSENILNGKMVSSEKKFIEIYRKI